ncbi:MAG: response regulator [Hornefia sp.]|nr:response regulator [Hornefia sp.]
MCRLTVVIADDEPIIRMDLRTMLANAGYNVVGEASDGFEAVELCKKYKPDVAILDIRMGDLDGLSAAKYINEDLPTTAIIMLTAYSKGEYIDRARENGISTYLVKPINEKMIVFNIELAVARNKELLEYRKHYVKANEQLESRKIIEKCKGLLMEHRNMTEKQAYEYIREISKKRNIAMYKVAAMLIKQYEV